MFVKLALFVGKMAAQHGHKILHAGNPDLLTRDLGAALREQKDILSNPRKSAFVTVYDVMPVVMEVKILTFMTAYHLGIPTQGRNSIDILDDIVQAADARNGGLYAKDLKETLEWTRDLFSHPEMQAILSMDITPVDIPKNPVELPAFFMQILGRSQDELNRLSEFMRCAKLREEGDQDKKQTPAKKKSNGPKP